MFADFTLDFALKPFKPISSWYMSWMARSWSQLEVFQPITDFLYWANGNGGDFPVSFVAFILTGGILVWILFRIMTAVVSMFSDLIRSLVGLG